MDYLPNDLLHLSLSYLDLGKYHRICVHINIKPNYNQYFIHHKDNYRREYIFACMIGELEIVKHLYDHIHTHGGFDDWLLDMPYKYECLDIAQFLHDKGERFSAAIPFYSVMYRYQQMKWINTFAMCQ